MNKNQTTKTVMEDLKERIGLNIRQMRRASGLTTYEFSRKLGISRNFMYKIESGEANMLPIKMINYIKRQVNLDKFFTHDLSLAFKMREQENGECK
jgi:transcriptional regulator with XRE-family HTH domain